MSEEKAPHLSESIEKPSSKFWREKLAFLLSPNVRLSLVTVFLLAAIGWHSLAAVEEEMKRNLAAQLQTTLSANVEALKIWIKDKKLDAEVLASQPEILEKTISLLEFVQKKDLSPEVLKRTDELIWLRKHLGAACKKYGFIGFVLLDSSGFQAGALLDEALGKRKVIERSDFFYRSLQGDTVVSPPFMGEIDLPDIHGIWQKNWPTMFASTPISNPAGDTVGVLAFRIRPEIAFTRMLEINRWGNTGETYAFNGEGLMLSDSRFNPQLKKAGLLPDFPETRAILQMQIRDPGGNMEKGFHSPLPRSQQPLTFMADSATKGKTGVNVTGYRDYRGVLVVGAWSWLPDHYFGVATEMDVDEAFAPLQTMNYWFALIFGLFALSTFFAFVFHIRQVRTEKNRQSAIVELERSNTELQNLAAVASHDLQEPLRKIMIYGDRLEEQISNQETQGRDAVMRMQKSAEQMRLLIEDLLEFSKVTNKTKKFSCIDLNELIPNIVEDLDFLIQKNQGKVVVGPLPTIEGDIIQIRQLFQNLISNAANTASQRSPLLLKSTALQKNQMAIFKFGSRTMGSVSMKNTPTKFSSLSSVCTQKATTREPAWASLFAKKS